MAYQSSVWLGCVAALCPSLDSVGDGTTTVTDFSLVSDGALTNMDAATDWVTDEGKRALDFDGINDHALTALTPIGGARRLSIAIKFRRVATTGTASIFSLSNAINLTNARLIGYVFTDGNLYIQFDGANAGFFSYPLTNLDWRSLIVQFDGNATGNANRLNVWLDGVQQSLGFTGTIPASLATITAGRLHLGVISDSSPIYGRSRIDDVRVNVRLFSVAERAEIDASRGGTYALSDGSPRFSGMRNPSLRLGT